jgi:hypothetical protein
MLTGLFALGRKGMGSLTNSAASILVMVIAMLTPLFCFIVVVCVAFWECRLKPRAFLANQQVEVQV